MRLRAGWPGGFQPGWSGKGRGGGSDWLRIGRLAPPPAWEAPRPTDRAAAATVRSSPLGQPRAEGKRGRPRPTASRSADSGGAEARKAPGQVSGAAGPGMEGPSSRVTLNVGGLRYRTCRRILAAFPGTKLGGLAEPGAAARFDYDARAGEFFFDRSGRLFEHVLHLCRSGHLHGAAAAAANCRAALRTELAFWGLSEARLPACCWSELCPEGEEAEEAEQGGPGQPEDRRGLLERVPRGTGGPWARWARPAWAFLEEPHSSPWATGFAVGSLLFNVAVIIILCVKGGQPEDSIGGSNFTHPHIHYHSVESLCPQIPSLLHLELFFILCFMGEFVVRLVFCPDKKKFFQKPLNVFDFLALFPVCLDLSFSGHAHKPEALPCWLNLFRVVYIIKLLKVFKLVETPLMLKVFPYMFKSILKEIAILMWVFLFEILFFGTLMLFAELIENHPDLLLRDIFSSFWWAVITLTTVGYGDRHPTRPASKVIGACAVLCGLLTIIIPIPIFFIKFKNYYISAVIKEKKKREEKATVTTSEV
ncbi:potassium voltage-gated channel subfamily C member 1-like [Crotalus tigris]|uniref:potassium voltage-gated channel subfamily C member 1-like n=1 Tax=Crotalus tigris TaxID=88082 RepID=UPI00192F25D2|nr:potassium voltage-gated channel subfamily C member 1-like [Crotalus tigris]